MEERVQGLVRPFISIALTLMLGYLVYQGQVDAKTLLAIYGAVIGFHFGSRSRKEDS